LNVPVSLFWWALLWDVPLTSYCVLSSNAHVSFFAIEMVHKEARISASKQTVRAGTSDLHICIDPDRSVSTTANGKPSIEEKSVAHISFIIIL
jgi:hypothetical protein